MAKVEVGGSGIDSKFDSEGTVFLFAKFEAVGEFLFGEDLSRAGHESAKLVAHV